MLEARNNTVTEVNLINKLNISLQVHSKVLRVRITTEDKFNIISVQDRDGWPSEFYFSDHIKMNEVNNSKLHDNV